MLEIQPRLQKVVPLILQIIGLLASLYAMKIIRIKGRKELMQFGLFYMGAIYILVAICFQIEQGSRDSHPVRALLANVVIVCGLCVCRWIFSMTLGPVVWLYLAEIVEPDVAGVATMINWTTAAIVSLTYPLLVELTGSQSLIFCLFSVFVFIGYSINKKWMVETKDKP
jgi:MFS family permease